VAPTVNGATLSTKIVWWGSSKCGPTSITITANVTDNKGGSGVASVTMQLRETQTGGQSTHSLAKTGANTYAVTFQGANLNGHYVFLLGAKDKKGNDSGFVRNSGWVFDAQVCLT